jgi:hypothetical protein
LQGGTPASDASGVAYRKGCRVSAITADSAEDSAESDEDTDDQTDDPDNVFWHVVGLTLHSALLPLYARTHPLRSKLNLG